jgi:hypothetical protein
MSVTVHIYTLFIHIYSPSVSKSLTLTVSFAAGTCHSAMYFGIGGCLYVGQ